MARVAMKEAATKKMQVVDGRVTVVAAKGRNVVLNSALRHENGGIGDLTNGKGGRV